MSILYVALFTSLAPIMMFLIRVLYKSKCNKINFCWGCLNFERDVKIETSLDDVPEPKIEIKVPEIQNETVKKEDLNV